MQDTGQDGRTPGFKLLMAILIAAFLTVPLFAVYLLVYDRQAQSATATTTITAGWGGPQVIAGPMLVLPYEQQVIETVNENGRPVQHSRLAQRELVLSPDALDLSTSVMPQKRRKSIYVAVVYEAQAEGRARFSLPVDLARSGVNPDQLHYDRAELRFGLSDARGLYGPPPTIVADGHPLRLQPGHGPAETGGSGFFAFLDAGAVRTAPIAVSFRLGFRGNGSLSLAPTAGDTRWRLTSPWPDPSFGGGFLPVDRALRADGFAATWRVGNLALGRPLAASTDPDAAVSAGDNSPAGPDHLARVDLVSPVDLYSEVNRSVKYGFLFVGFTFMAFLMFDVIGGVRVATAEYLLVGVGLILFFVMLLAFAEVIGFTPAYLLAAAAIIGLITAYSAAVLKSWRRGLYLAALLTGLYAVLYVLLSLEAYSLLIGSVLLFAALAAIMYLTRNIDWGGLSRRPLPDGTV